MVPLLLGMREVAGCRTRDGAFARFCVRLDGNFMSLCTAPLGLGAKSGLESGAASTNNTLENRRRPTSTVVRVPSWG